MERTGGGGLHVYAALPDGVKVASVPAYLTPGIELLADGRVVAVAPSETAKGPLRGSLSMIPGRCHRLRSPMRCSQR